jgi:hypothetical protein
MSVASKSTCLTAARPSTKVEGQRRAKLRYNPMKCRFGPSAGWLGCLAFLVVACGGASGGTTSGGSGGDPFACNEDADCVACAFPTPPQAKAECYCASCAGAPLSKTACAANKAAWENSCTPTPILCGGGACVQPPVPQCKSNRCVAAK